MRLAEAQAILGQYVVVTFRKRGTYIGTLHQVEDQPGRSAWRGKVKIAGVMSVGDARDALRIGDEIEAGAVRIRRSTSQDERSLGCSRHAALRWARLASVQMVSDESLSDAVRETHKERAKHLRDLMDREPPARPCPFKFDKDGQ